MSENQKPQVRSEEPELSDEALEQVAGGCEWGESINNGSTDVLTIVPTLPSF